jgi:methyl-accepting chemotaxis protein
MPKSRSIAQQISNISFSLIAGLVILSALAIGTTLLVKSTFVDYRDLSKSTLTAAAVFEDISEAQAAVLKWRINSDPAQAEEFRANIAEIRQAESELKQMSGDAADIEIWLAEFEAKLVAFETQFEKMYQIRIQFQTVNAEIDNAGVSARKALTEIMETAFQDQVEAAGYHAGRAQEALMLGRYYLQKFRQTEAAEDLARSTAETLKSLDSMQTLLTQLENPRRIELAEQVIASLTSVGNRAEELGQAMTAELSARAVLDTLGPELVGEVETLSDAAVARQIELGPRGITISLWAVVLICGAATVIVAIGWVVSRKMSTRISASLDDAVSTMTKIAGGDLDTEVHHATDENEIGRMARALEVFKSNGKAAIASAEREKQAEQERQQVAEVHKQQQEARDIAAREQAEASRRAMIAELSASLGQVVNAASEGDFSQRVNADFADMELSDLAGNVNTLVLSVDKGIAATAEAMRRVAQGDLSELMEGDFKGAFKDLQNNTNSMISSLKSLIGEIGGSTVNLASSSQELRDTADVLSKQAEQNAASLEETSAALEELTASIKQVSENVADANKNASFASDTAKSSGVVAADAAEAMQRISEASKEIAKVVTVINDIAFQINLLALNAGVEAARAGDAGRGFSVVASEVRQLAQRASDAAKEIGDVIARSDYAVNEGVSKVTNAQESLEKISQSVVGVSRRIDEIANAISEQVNGVGEINTAVSQIDRNTQKQAASFEEVTAASSLLSNEAAGLKNSAARFKTGNEVISLRPAKETPAMPDKKSKVLAPQVVGNLARDLDGWDEF